MKLRFKDLVPAEIKKPKFRLVFTSVSGAVVFSVLAAGVFAQNPPADASAGAFLNANRDATAAPAVELGDENLGWQCKFNYKPWLFDCSKIEKPKPPVVTDSQKAEKEILDYLTLKKSELDFREETLRNREKELSGLEKRIELKLNEVNKWNTDVEQERKKKQQEDMTNLKSLVSYYEKMAPENAAAVFNQLDEQTAAKLLTSMNARKSSAIMALLDPRVSVRLTERIAAIRQNREAFMTSDVKP